MGEADNDVLREILVYLEELPVVHNGADHLVHVVRGVRIVGYYLVEAVVHTAHGVVCGDYRCLLHVVLGNI